MNRKAMLRCGNLHQGKGVVFINAARFAGFNVHGHVRTGQNACNGFLSLMREAVPIADLQARRYAHSQIHKTLGSTGAHTHPPDLGNARDLSHGYHNGFARL